MVAVTKVPLFKEYFWHFQIKIGLRKTTHKAGQHPATGCWFLLDYSLSGPPAFKSQRVRYQSNQKLLHHYQHQNNQLYSYIHLKIQVLESQELKSHCHFWQGTLKNDWINFQPSCICSSMQKIRLFHLFSFDIPKTRLATLIFDHAHPINFWSAFNCYESASACKTFVHSQIESILESHRMTGHIHFLTTPTPKIFNVCYNQLKSVNSWDTVNFRVQRPDCSVCSGEIAI